MTASEAERAAKVAARTVMRRLATGEESPRAELFAGLGGIRLDWQQKLLRRLAKLGVVERIGDGKYTTWRLAEGDEAATLLQALSTDDEALTPVLTGLHARFTIDMLDGAPVVEAEGDGEAESESAELGGGLSLNGAATGDDVRLDFILKLLAASLENMIYIREGVDELKGRMSALEEAFK